MKNKRREHAGIIDSFQKAQEQNEKDNKIIASENVSGYLLFPNAIEYLRLFIGSTARIHRLRYQRYLQQGCVVEKAREYGQFV